MLRENYILKEIFLSDVTSGDSAAKTSGMVFVPYKSRLKEVWITVNSTLTARGKSNVNLVIKTAAGATVGTIMLGTTASGGTGDITAGTYENATGQITVDTEIASNSSFVVSATTNGNGQDVSAPSLALVLEPVGAE
ncbi:hypothetical protein LCGC14_2132190 [marine sediment metagenome]|uniref:Uncharacterized protein n=1 Tax=marine sediment metagenome TaxID=412755 RepID=A0A0F9E103_9ZZZZ